MRHWLLLWMLVLLTACNQGDAGSPASSTAVPKEAKLETNLANLPNSPKSFESAKKILYNEIYKGHDVRFTVAVIMIRSQKSSIGKVVVLFHVKMPNVLAALKLNMSCPRINLETLDNAGVNRKKSVQVKM